MPPRAGPPRLRCPACGSFARQRLLALFLEAAPELLPAGARVLHFAPEEPIRRMLLDEARISYLSADIEPGRAMVEADVTDLPFEEGSFDLVLISHVLEHVPDDARAITELRRILSEEGRLVLQHPINYDSPTTYEDTELRDREERLRRFSQSDHVRVYGADFGQRVAQAGLTVRLAYDAAALSPGLIERHGLQPRFGPIRNDIYLCWRA
jgi:SAM-dependent methyltransferase